MRGMNSRLNAPNDLLAEESFGSDQKEDERKHIREPSLDSAADVRTQIDLGEFFRCADDEATEDSAGNRIESAEDQHRQRLQCDESQRVLDAVARAPQQSGDQRDGTG